MSGVGGTRKGGRRRAELVAAAAELVLAGAGVSHRALAERAGASLSATTYYFTSLDAILAAAGEHIAAGWVLRAEGVAAAVEAGAPLDVDVLAEALLDAILPADAEIAGHYAHLVAAAQAPALAGAYAAQRPALDAAVERILRAGDAGLGPGLAVAVVDGAVVSALSEGSDARARARELVRAALLR